MLILFQKFFPSNGLEYCLNSPDLLIIPMFDGVQLNKLIFQSLFLHIFNVTYIFACASICCGASKFDVRIAIAQKDR